MASGSGNRKSRRERELSGTNRADRDRLLSGEYSDRICALLDAWVGIAQSACVEIDEAGAVTILNAGEQLQKHPAVTVLETASKRVEALVLLADQFDESGAQGVLPDLPDGAPAPFKPRAV